MFTISQRYRFFLNALLLLCLLSLTGCYGRSIAPVIDGWKTGSKYASEYRVQPGDTLYSIAFAFGLDYRDLAAANHIPAPYAIKAGQELAIKMPSATGSAKKTIATATPTRAVQKPRKTASKQAAKTSYVYSTQPVRGWRAPAKGRVIDKFSDRYGGNKGIDIAGQFGEAIVAAAPGVVVYSGSGLRGYGKLIIIKHNSSYLSAYAYNKNLLVKEGQRVSAGQKIAEMGKNLQGTVMLHFEVRKNGQPVNPLKFVRYHT